MRIITVALASIACLSWTTASAAGQDLQTMRAQYQANYYTMAPAAKQVTITDRAGRVLSVIDVPADVAVSLHLMSGEYNNPNEQGANPTFAGDVSIRTRPRSELVQGPMFDQMMSAPFKLDVKDVVVVLTTRR